MELLKKRLSNLLAVKSIVTVILTAVFAYLTCTGVPHRIHRGDRILLRYPGRKAQLRE